MSQFLASSDSAPRMSIVCVRFEIDFPPPMVVGIALLGVAVLLVTWDVGAALAPAGGSVPPASSVGMAGENTGSSLWKMNWNSNRSALVATTLFLTMLVVVLG